MYIKSIVIDGFKTYGKTTEIKNLDPQFNAITGPNGTGKSNILDAICFALGMQNARQMRGESFIDLIYQRGSADVTKAVVTLIFDNNDPNTSPPILRDHKEVTIARQITPSSSGIKSSYLLNGRVVQYKNIMDIFNAIHLNVNNPHFLVMQGQIIRVLNNTPAQNAALIEEAIGTSVYQMKKVNGEKELLKKEKLKNYLNMLLKDTVDPFIDKVHQERNRSAELRKLQNEYTSLEKYSIAYKYIQLQRDRSELSLMIQATTDKELAGGKEISEMQEKLSSIERELKENHRLLNTGNGNILTLIKNKIQKAEEDASNVMSEIKELKEKQTTEEENVKLLAHNMDDHMEIYEKNCVLLKSAETTYKSLQDEKAECLRDYKTAESKFELARSGQFIDPVNRIGDSLTLQDQITENGRKIMDVRGSILKFRLEMDDCKMKINFRESELKRLETSVAKKEEEIKQITNSISSIKEKIATLNFDEDEFTDLKLQQTKLKSATEQLKEKLGSYKYRQLQFHFEPPTRNFNKKAVRGRIVALMKSVDKKYNMALEIAAGSKMHGVVVDDDKVSLQLIREKSFENRTTFIPLNQIRRHTIPQTTVHKAKSIVGEDNVHLALSLVKFDKVLQPAMEYVFGNTLICSNNDVASTLAFHDDIQQRCVSLAGDITDPFGEQTGGSARTFTPILHIYEEYENLKSELESTAAAYKKVEDRLSSLSLVEQSFEDLKNKLMIEEYKLATCDDHFERKKHLDLQQEILAYKQKLDNIPLELDKYYKLEEEYMTELDDVKKKIDKFSLNHDQLLTELCEDTKRLAAKLKDIENQLKLVENCDNIRNRLETIENEVKQVKQQMMVGQESLISIKDKIERKMETYENKMQVLRNLELDEKAEIEKMANQNNDMCQLRSNRSQLESDIRMKKFDIQLLKEKKTSFEQKFKKYNDQLNEYNKKFEWIALEYKHFGIPGGEYDFTNYESNCVDSRLNEINDKIKYLNRGANIDLDNLNDEEMQYESIISKIKAIDHDKENLRTAIAIADKQKNEALRDAWEKINKDFGDIFRKVLPGADAKLETLPGKIISDGLQIKVSLGEVWKNDLSELSGGQKSLAALSLILAMSLYKPAPIYILDEVDAALDLSHTQNIGEMIKQHFKNSQFIVVSLKEGMFTNANAIFRTQFKNSVSQVNRVK